MNYSVEILHSLTISDYNDILSLLKELSGSDKFVSFESVETIIRAGYLFVARNENGTLDAMLTLVFYNALSGKKSWIEDVIVRRSCRGQGISKQMLNLVIDFARKQGFISINLTSRPSRMIAHELYKSVGFKIRETDVMQMIL